jgi:protein-tyrosine kinase
MRLPFLRRDGRSRDRRDVPPFPGSANNDLFFLEQFKALRAKVEYKIDMLKYRILAVTSAVAGEGKTLTSANLAMQLASVGRKKVLLIDADLRKSDVSRVLSIRPLPGLSEFLFGSVELRDVIRHSPVPGLDAIPGGTRLSNPTDHLAGERFRSFLQGFGPGGGNSRPDYDVVILDTPPVLPVADTLALKDLVDAFLFVFRAGFTPYKLFQQALEETGDRNVLGVVLNGVEPQSQYYYRRYYGSYYSRISGDDRTG